jgi:hypothetical protein
LRGKCALQWIGSVEDLMKEFPSSPKLPRNLDGVTMHKMNPSGDVQSTPRIRLNADMCLKNAKSLDEAKRKTFGTLLHEMIHGKFSSSTKTGILRANDLTAHEIIRCTGHPRCDIRKEVFQVTNFDSFGHGPNFQRCALVLCLRRTKDDLGFEVMWNHRLEEELRFIEERRKGDDPSNLI